MTRLIRPLVYILGFSVFCACTTTGVVDLSSTEPGDKVGGLVWVTMREDGSKVLMRDAYRSEESITGLDDDGNPITLSVESIEQVEPVRGGWMALIIVLPALAIMLVAAALSIDFNF